MKKYTLAKIALSAVFAVSVACFAVGCGKTQNNSQGGNEPIDSSTESVDVSGVNVMLDKSNVMLEMYDKIVITPSLVGADEADVKWSSSNASVAEVKGGEVLAKTVGTAVITATAKGVSANCNVTVTPSKYSPKIELGDEVYLTVGRNYTTEINCFWNREDITDLAKYSVALSGSAESGIANASISGNTLSITAVSGGYTEFVISASAREKTSRTILGVTVYENEVFCEYKGDKLVPNKSYYTVNIATTSLGDYFDTVELDFDVIVDGAVKQGATIEWSKPNDESIVSLEGSARKGYTLVGHSAGSAMIEGTYTDESGATCTVSILATVFLPEVALDETTLIDASKTTLYTVENDIVGNIENVVIGGKSVLKRASGNTIFFNGNFPTRASELGETEMYIYTDKVCYEMPIEIYSLVINNKDDLDAMAAIAENARENSMQWDGYFILGGDIDYNGVYTSMIDLDLLFERNKALGAPIPSNYDFAIHGFMGVFDGRGYNIDGLAVRGKKLPNSQGGLIGVLADSGVVRNVSFTNATVYENNGFICCAGGGLIENVRIAYKSVGVGIDNRDIDQPSTYSEPRYMGSFFCFRANKNAKVRDCFIDTTGADIKYVVGKYGLTNLLLAGRASAMENVVAVCTHEEALKKTGASYSYGSLSELVADVEAAGIFDEWDKSFWKTINGIPFTPSTVASLDVDKQIEFNEKADRLFVGQPQKLTVNESYSEIAFVGDHTGVTYEKGVVYADESAVGNEITLKATSFINSSSVEMKLIVTNVTEISVTPSERVLITNDTTSLNLSEAAQYIGDKVKIFLGDTLIGEGLISAGKVAIDGTKMDGKPYGEVSVNIVSEKSQDNFYLVNFGVVYVTKIIETLEDMNDIRMLKSENVAINGYYVLGNDIDGNGQTVKSLCAQLFYSGSYGFRGTFDGNGKKISNVVYGERGLFGHMGTGAVVKDVTFDNCTITENLSACVMAATMVGVTLENVTVNVTGYKNILNDECTHGILSSRYFNNCILNDVVLNAEGIDLDWVFGYVMTGDTFNNVKLIAKSYKYLAYPTDSLTVSKELIEKYGLVGNADGKFSHAMIKAYPEVVASLVVPVPDGLMIVVK